MLFYETIQEVLGIRKECIKVDVNTTVTEGKKFDSVKYLIELTGQPKEPQEILKCLI